MMEHCWLCKKTFPGKKELNAHLASKEHRHQTVICPWCPGEKTFTRVTDLNAHCQNRHFVELHILPKSFLGLNNCFYFAIYPQDYARMHKPEGWTSPNAIEAMRLVIALVEGRDDASVKRENWRIGWREGLKVRAEEEDSDKENVKTAKRARIENEYRPGDLRQVNRDYKEFKALHEKTKTRKPKKTQESKKSEKKRENEVKSQKQVTFSETEADEKVSPKMSKPKEQMGNKKEIQGRSEGAEVEIDYENGKVEKVENKLNQGDKEKGKDIDIEKRVCGMVESEVNGRQEKRVLDVTAWQEK